VSTFPAKRWVLQLFSQLLLLNSELISSSSVAEILGADEAQQSTAELRQNGSFVVHDCSRRKHNSSAAHWRSTVQLFPGRSLPPLPKMLLAIVVCCSSVNDHLQTSYLDTQYSFPFLFTADFFVVYLALIFSVFFAYIIHCYTPLGPSMR